MTTANSNVVQVAVEPGSQAFTILAANSPFDEQSTRGFGTGAAFAGAAMPNEGEPTGAQQFGTLESSAVSIGTVGAFFWRFTGFSNNTVSIAIQGASAPPAQNAFGSLTYTDDENNVLVLPTNDLGGGGSYVAGTGNWASWTWDLGVQTNLGHMTGGTQYTATLATGGAAGVPAPVLTGVLTDESSIFTLSWQSAAASPTGFTLYRGVDGAQPTVYQQLGPTPQVFADQLDTGPVDISSTYQYYLTVTTAAGTSGPSNELTVTIDGGTS